MDLSRFTEVPIDQLLELVYSRPMRWWDVRSSIANGPVNTVLYETPHFVGPDAVLGYFCFSLI